MENKLSDNGFKLSAVKETSLTPSRIKALLNSYASAESKPDIAVITEALTTADSTSFKKYFAEIVAAAERSENKNTPAPKDYWKQRNKAFGEAKKRGASDEELEQLEEQYKIYRKKSKIFNLNDFGNGYKGYCFMYKGIRVAVLPKVSLTGAELDDMVCLACVRTKQNFENSAEDYPDGFSKLEYIPPKTGFVNQFIPRKGDGGGEICRKCVAIASFLVFMVALSLLFYNMVFLNIKNAELNGEIQRIAHGIDDSGDKKPQVDDQINWGKLLKINDEIVGWIQLDGTKVDYPVLWHKSDDRNGQFYLAHNYKGEYDSFGSIFLDYRCTKGTDSKNVVIHGHHMNDGSMFGDLMKYGGTTGNLDFYKKAPTIEFDTPDGNGTYKIISVFKTNTLSSHGEFFNYMVGNFQNEKDFMNYVYNVRVRSLFNCPVTVNEDDELITLSTCSYEYTNFRTVVVARKVRVGESEKVDVKKASLNKNAVWPQVHYSGGSRPEVTDFCTSYDKGQIKWYDGDYDFKNQKVKTPVAEATTATNKSGQVVTQKPTAPPKVYCTVKFLNYDGSVMETQKVEYGKAAKAPKNPVKPSDEYYDYTFKKWQLDFSKVTCNMTIAPTFEPTLKPQYAAAQGGG